MDQVLTQAPLRGEFMYVRESDSRVVWREAVVDEYLSQVEGFLRQLLLLVHLTGGQLAHATELVSLQHCNTPEGCHQSIFIENGLVGTVTSYHKGQIVTNSIKIIHCYLPRVVSELLVYYLWLIQPFAETAAMLAQGRNHRVRSPFLWPGKADGRQPWDAKRLGQVLRQEAHTHLQTKLDVLSYRHAAIGISHMHLRQGSGFKWDYGIEETTWDLQAAYGPWLAGTVYARGLCEAPGVVEAWRVRFWQVSREWHAFLGFEASAASGRKQRYAEMMGSGGGGGAAWPRSQEYVSIEFSEDEGG